MEKEKLFSQLCSVYENVKDNYGRFVDRDTGELIQQMTIHDFCLTERWRPAVEKLRSLRDMYGSEAKKRDDYVRTKAMLPGATLSGLFDLREEMNNSTGRMEVKSRVTSHLKEHTGWLCIDIDAQDNTDLASMKTVLRTLRHRQEIALMMLSCSGTGYFALIPLAYPHRHKEQFAALLAEYDSIGIHLDRQCADVTRVRFASYDAHPFINLNAVPYTGILEESAALLPKAPLRSSRQYENNVDNDISKVDVLVRRLEESHIDITNDYHDWVMVGFALSRLPEPWGRQFFHRVSALCPKYNTAKCDKQFDHCKSANSVKLGTFFKICRDHGITLRY